MLTLDVHDVGIAFTPAANSVLFDRIERLPVFVLSYPLLFIQRRRFKIGWSIELSITRRVRGTMLYCCMSVANVAKVVYIFWREQYTCCK